MDRLTVPLLNYKPSTQDQRVESFGLTEMSEDALYVYRLTPTSTDEDLDQIIWAAYRQVFTQHGILEFNRQKSLESLLRNRTINVRDFIRGLAKSSRFYELIVSTNDCYRLVNLCFKRLLGRAPYNADEEIAWSVKTSTLGFHGFIDALIDSPEYTDNFGDSIVPYPRRRLEKRPFQLETPRYGRDYYERDLAMTGKPDWRFIMAKFYHGKDRQRGMKTGDPRQFSQMAQGMAHKPKKDQVSTVKVRNFDVDYYLRKWLG